MRVGVVFFAERNKAKLKEISRGLAAGIESQGHRVEIIDAFADSDSRLSLYDYLAVGAESLSFFRGKISQKIPQFLANAGTSSGKRCFAFILTHPVSANRALGRLMKAMEHEGMYLKFSDILSSKEQAEAVGKRLIISN